MSAVTICELTPELIDDYLSFFDGDAFSDNPDWAMCYCAFHHFPGTLSDWQKVTGQDTRSLISDLIRQGKPHGLLAYFEGRVVGWCNAAPRDMLPNITRFGQMQLDEADRVGAIACFVIARPHRRRGIARQLLDAACEMFRRQGLTTAEAYPGKGARSQAENYPGPLDMYLSAGFRVIREFERFCVVQKAL
jgi:GNAT superfamily N-acetyltransferase